MATTRKLKIISILQGGTNLLNEANFANNTADITVNVEYTTESADRTFIRLVVHLSRKDRAKTESPKRHKKGDVMFEKKFRLTGSTVVGTGLNLTIPSGKLDYSDAVYVVHVRDREGLAAASRNIARG